MNAEHPRDTPNSGETTPPPPARESPGEPVVTGSPSSHQPAGTPPAGSEPQGRTTIIATIVTVITVVVLIIFIFL